MSNKECFGHTWEVLMASLDQESQQELKEYLDDESHDIFKDRHADAYQLRRLPISRARPADDRQDQRPPLD